MDPMGYAVCLLLYLDLCWFYPEKKCGKFIVLNYPIASMGMVYLPTWMVDFYGFHVGKYTIPMNPVGTLDFI